MMIDPPMLRLAEPPSAGHYWRLMRGRIVKLQAARDYQQAVKARALAARIRPTLGRIALMIRWVRSAKRGDLDNRLKVVLDALQGAVYHNDNQIVELHAYREDGKQARLDVSWEERT